MSGKFAYLLVGSPGSQVKPQVAQEAFNKLPSDVVALSGNGELLLQFTSMRDANHFSTELEKVGFRRLKASATPPGDFKPTPKTLETVFRAMRAADRGAFVLDVLKSI